MDVPTIDSSEPPKDPVPAFGNLPATGAEVLPDIIRRAGKAAVFAAEEFFFGKLRNPHTRAAYLHAVKRFLAWCEQLQLELHQITPKLVGQYLDEPREHETSISARKQHLAALRRFFDEQVTRHAVILNPAASVRGERYQVVEGKTQEEITVPEARELLASLDAANVVGLRDPAIIAILIYAASWVDTVAKLKRGSLYNAGDWWMLHFDEKGGKSGEIPVRLDLEQFLFEYIDAPAIRHARKETPLFRSAARKEKRLTANAMHVNDVCRMVKRRMKDAGLASRLSPHSFGVTTITDLLEQGVPLEDVQHLAGHADPRTTQLYDQRQKKITRNIVETISI